MIPVGSRDAADPTKAFPLVTVGLVLANVLVFLYEIALPSDQVEAFINQWALVPCEYTSQCAIVPGTPVPFWLTLFSSMFLHGGWDHLLGNMLFLAVFGIHVERSMGRLRFLGFYFVCGLGASALEIATSASSDLPGIGASGAIAGVLAGYLLMYPTSHIDSLIPIGRFFYWPARVPAWIFIGLWFLYQLALSVISFGDVSAGGGVAYSAHVGGFITGLVLVRIFMRPDWVDRIRTRQSQPTTPATFAAG
jgi:membrane associated rhomboid family serine protease